MQLQVPWPGIYLACLKYGGRKYDRVERKELLMGRRQFVTQEDQKERPLVSDQTEGPSSPVSFNPAASVLPCSYGFLESSGQALGETGSWPGWAFCLIQQVSSPNDLDL